MKLVLTGLLALLWGIPLPGQAGPAQESTDNTAAYQRIDAERAQAMAGFAAEDAQCYQRFAVSACLKQVQSRRRAVLADLRSQETLLHEQERAQQAQEQRQRVAQKVRERQQQQADLQAENGEKRAADKLQELEERQADHAANAAKPAASATARPIPAGPTAAEQAANRDSFARKQQEAEKKRQDLARRLAEKASKPAAPLPLPR